MTGRPPDFEPDEIRMIEELGLTGFAGRERPDCPLPDVLQSLAAGALPPSEMAALCNHLKLCHGCRMVHDAFAEFSPPSPERQEIDRLWSRIAMRIPQQGILGLRGGWGWAWPAALAALAITGVLLIPSLVAPEPVRLSLSAPSPAAPFLQTWNEDWLRTPPVRLPAKGLLVWRGSPADPIPPHTRDVAKALEPYREGDFAAAAARLEALERAYPASYEVSFYRGVCLLRLGEPGASAQLERSRRIASSNQRADADWYLALAYLQQGSVRAAWPLLTSTCSGFDTHSAQACTILRLFERPEFAPSRR